MHAGPPAFTVVIPTYNRAAALRACLAAVQRLDAPRGGFEVVVVDDGSETPVDAVIEACRRPGLDVRLERQPNAGPASARNRGAAVARGRYLAFTDDDCAPDPGWLAALARRLEADPGCAAGGRTLNGLPDNLYSTASQELVAYLYDCFGRDAAGGAFFASNNMAVAAGAFRHLGGFDDTFARAAAEDRDFFDRWRHAGHPMAYEPAAVVYHAHPLGIAGFWRQHLGYGRGARVYHLRRARRRGRRVRVEPWAFYRDLVRFPFAQGGVARPWLVSGLLALSQVATVAGYFLERFGIPAVKRRGRADLPGGSRVQKRSGR